jgi:hypothetical protein
MPDVLVADARPYVQYACDGVQTVFTYPFPILAAEDLTVVLDDGTTPAGVSVGGVGADTGGTVTLSPAPAAGRTLTLFRDMPIARTSDFQESGAFRASAINAELDRLAMMLQQVETLAGQAVKRAPEDTDDALVLPPAAVRAGCVLAFDTQGRPNASEAPSAAAARAVDAADAADTAASAADASAVAADQAKVTADSRASDAEGHAAAAETSAQTAGTHAANAQSDAGTAAASASAAEAWADTPEDVEVVAGRYSAFHWAAKAAINDMLAERRRADLVAVRARQSAGRPGVAVMPVWAFDAELAAGLDNFSITRTGDAYVVDARGDLVLAPPNSLRVDHDPATGRVRGLLVEDARTNLLHDSFAPASQTHTLGAGTYTLSVHGAGTCALSGGATGTASAGAPVTFTLGASAQVGFTVSGGPTAIQCELGETATSPIATPGTGSATRQLDGLTLTETGWIDPTGMSVVIEARLPFVPNAGLPRLFSYDSGTTANRHELFWFGSDRALTLYAKSSGAGQPLLQGPVDGWLPGAEHRIGFSIGGGVRDFYIDGVRIGGDTIVEPSGLTNLYFGRAADGTAWNGTIRRIAVYPRRLTEADLIALTQ